MRKTLLGVGVALVAAGGAPAGAGAACGHGCRHYERRVIAPYRGWLASTGACESSGGYDLRTGLRSIGGGGLYRGRYQMTFDIWGAVGGHGDPAGAGWLEQAYRAVKVRVRYGRGQWPVCG